jgi:hypothetical protein
MYESEYGVEGEGCTLYMDCKFHVREGGREILEEYELFKEESVPTDGET